MQINLILDFGGKSASGFSVKKRSYQNMGIQAYVEEITSRVDISLRKGEMILA